MVSAPGLGVMLSYLGGNEKTIAALEEAKGRRVLAVSLADDALRVHLTGGALKIYDDGQSCCEARYITCDDDLGGCDWGTLVGVEQRGGAWEEGSSAECHETAFVVVTTSLRTITICTHNEHNGYYGGFALRAAWYPNNAGVSRG